MTEAILKRELVRQLLREGGFARRLEDKYAIGTLDLLLLTHRHLIYAEAKLLNDIAAMPATVKQRDQIKIFNEVGNRHARALVLGLKDKAIGFNLPGRKWDEHYTMPWPLVGTRSLTEHLDNAVDEIFAQELA